MDPNASRWPELHGAALPDAVNQALTPERLCERASRLARLDDYGDPGFLVGLERLCSAFQHAGLTPMGYLSVGARVTRALVTRLLWVEMRRTAPERFSRPLSEPLVIIGPTRSGSTFLHHLLCTDPSVRFLPYWEAREPIAPPDEDDRRTRAAHMVDLVRENVPNLPAQHALDVDAPDECVYLFDPSFLSPSFYTDAPIQPYLEWLLEQDLGEPYRVYRELLSYIQSSAPDQRLVLKSPAHLGSIRALVAAVPEAKIVQLHRDPLAVLPSACALFETVHRMTCGDLDRRALGGWMLRLLEHQLRSNSEQRAALAPGSLFDLQFSELTADPVGSVARIYAHFGWSWSNDIEGRVRGFVVSRTREHVVRDRHDLAEFGLNAVDVAERFRGYRQNWGLDTGTT